MGIVSRSLRLKISLGVSLALVLLLAPFNWFLYQLQRGNAIADLSRLAATTGAVAEYSMEGAMLAHNRPAIQTIVDSVAQAPGVQTVYLLNPQATVAASPGGRLNHAALDRGSALCQPCHRFPAQSRPRSIVVHGADGQPVFRTMTPILNRPECGACHPRQDRLNGVLYVDFSMAGLNDRLEQGLRTNLLASAGIIVLAGLAIYAMLSWLVITPMERIARALGEFSRGRREARVAVRSQDEVGLLGRGFNEMADTIQSQATRAEMLYGELQAKDAARRQLLDRLTAVREDERRSLARELHDNVGQLLTGLSLRLQMGRKAMPGDLGAAEGHLAAAQRLITESIDASHRLIVDLRPTVLDDYGLIPALREEMERRLAPLGIQADLAAGEEPAELPPEIATAAFRIAQEAITNVIRHARAQRVRVQVERCDGSLSMSVEDDGFGLQSPASGGSLDGLGILGMQERAAALGGYLEVAARQPQGTRVHLWLPLQEKDR